MNVFEEVKAWRSFYPECIQSIEFYSPTRDEDIEDEEI